jgi:hypothetical protein
VFPHDSTDPLDGVRDVVPALGDAFDDEGPYSRELTEQALDALGTCTTYLRTCLGPAQRAAVPDVATLATVLLGLHLACTQLYLALVPALRGIDQRQWPADQRQVPITHVFAMRAALAGAQQGLRVAGEQFAAHQAVTDAVAQSSASPAGTRAADPATDAGGHGAGPQPPGADAASTRRVD